MNLARALVERGHEVVLWSAAFNHSEKIHRTNKYECIRVSPQLEVRLIPSIGYSRNIGIRRLMDHAQLALRLRRKLREEAIVPDVAFVGYPPIEAAAVLAEFLENAGIPFLMDVKDQWPGIFLNPLPDALKPIARLLLLPYFHLGRQAMSRATGLCAMAKGFLAWAQHFSGRLPRPTDAVFPLSPWPAREADTAAIDDAELWWDSLGVRCDGTPRFSFVGSLSAAFDFAPVKYAAERCQATGFSCQFIICGSGPMEAKVREMMAGLDNVLMPGWISQAKIEVLAKRSAASLAPYQNTEDFMMSIPNKILDALSFGQPVLTSLQGEVAGFVGRHRAGLVYMADKTPSLFECIENLLSNPGLREELSANAKSLFETEFSGERVYGRIVDSLENICASITES